MKSNIICPFCNTPGMAKKGLQKWTDSNGNQNIRQKYRCNSCGRVTTNPIIPEEVQDETREETIEEQVAEEPITETEQAEEEVETEQIVEPIEQEDTTVQLYKLYEQQQKQIEGIQSQINEIQTFINSIEVEEKTEVVKDNILFGKPPEEISEKEVEEAEVEVVEEAKEGSSRYYLELSRELLYVGQGDSKDYKKIMKKYNDALIIESGGQVVEQKKRFGFRRLRRM